MNDKSNLGLVFLDKFNPINWLIPITDWSHQPIDPIIYDPIKRHPLYNPFTNKMSTDFLVFFIYLGNCFCVQNIWNKIK